MSLLSRTKQAVRRLFPPFCENVNGAAHKTHSLLIYVTQPFRTRTSRLIHQNRWQVRELAQLLGRAGYNVDVVEWTHAARMRFRKRYDLIVDHRPSLGDVPRAYRDWMSPGRRRVAYLTTSNPAIANRAELQRLEGVYLRRGIRLKARRQMPLIRSDDIETFDAAWFMMNRRNLQTYSEFRLPPVTLLPNTGYSLLERALFTPRAPSGFLFLGGYGQVHKGLDLLLEVFSKRPHLTLYVCGHFTREEDFCRVYNKELFHTPNIVPVGSVDVHGSTFATIASSCAYVVLPSCAEGQSGSVLAGMSAGLIPLVSLECGFDEGEVHHLSSCALADIASAVEHFASQPTNWLREESARALQVVRDNYTEAHYSASVQTALESLHRDPVRAKTELTGV
jgi:glycosyl transferase family 1